MRNLLHVSSLAGRTQASWSDGAHISTPGEAGSAAWGNQEQNPDLLCMVLQVASKVFWQITTCGRCMISDREVSGGCIASVLTKDQINTGIIKLEHQTAQMQ